MQILIKISKRRIINHKIFSKDDIFLTTRNSGQIIVDMSSEKGYFETYLIQTSSNKTISEYIGHIQLPIARPKINL